MYYILFRYGVTEIEYDIVFVPKGQDTLHGRGSWSLYTGKAFSSFEQADRYLYWQEVYNILHP